MGVLVEYKSPSSFQFLFGGGLYRPGPGGHGVDVVGTAAGSCNFISAHAHSA